MWDGSGLAAIEGRQCDFLGFRIKFGFAAKLQPRLLSHPAWRHMEIPVADDPAVEKRHIVIVMTTGARVVIVVTTALPAVVENSSRRRLLGATTMAHLNFSDGPDRDRHQ